MAEYVSTFRMPSEYERAAMEARRRQRMAEMLAQQAYNPMEFQGAPIPKAAPFVQGLQAFLTARQLRKAEEAEKEAKATESDYAKRLAGRMGGVSELPDYGTPEQQMARIDAEEAAQRASGQLQEVTPTAQYRFNPQEALEMASTEVGTAALKNRPLMAQRLAKMLETPEGEEFYAPVLGADNKYVQFGKRGGNRVSTIAGPAESKIGKPSPGDFTPASIAKFATSGNYADLVPIPRPAPVTNINMPSEGERKDAYNLARVVNAASTINAATRAEPGAVTPGLKEATVSALPGVDEASYLAQSPQRQVVTAAQTDMIDALLTLATGAAYTKEQLAGQRAAILPRFGESKESIDAKKKRVRDLATAARIRAGRAWTPEMDKAIETAFGPVEEEPITDLPPRPR